MPRPPPTSTLFPYTTLFRSHAEPCARVGRGQGRRDDAAVGRDAGEQQVRVGADDLGQLRADRKSTRLNSSHVAISYAVFCLKKKKKKKSDIYEERRLRHA